MKNILIPILRIDFTIAATYQGPRGRDHLCLPHRSDLRNDEIWPPKGTAHCSGFTRGAFRRIDIDREHYFLGGTCNQVIPGLKSAIRG